MSLSKRELFADSAAAAAAGFSTNEEFKCALPKKGQKYPARVAKKFDKYSNNFVTVC